MDPYYSSKNARPYDEKKSSMPTTPQTRDIIKVTAPFSFFHEADRKKLPMVETKH
jgi:hypothetical protein